MALTLLYIRASRGLLWRHSLFISSVMRKEMLSALTSSQTMKTPSVRTCEGASERVERGKIEREECEIEREECVR